MEGDLFMASKKQEIRKQIKKKEAKELEELGLNPDIEVVDLSDDLGEDIEIETLMMLSRNLLHQLNLIQHLKKKKED